MHNAPGVVVFLLQFGSGETLVSSSSECAMTEEWSAILEGGYWGRTLYRACDTA